MRLNQRRATGSRTSPLEPIRTKTGLEVLLNESGYVIRESRAEGLMAYDAYNVTDESWFELGRFHKGEKRDWPQMGEYFLHKLKQIRQCNQDE